MKHKPILFFIVIFFFILNSKLLNLNSILAAAHCSPLGDVNCSQKVDALDLSYSLSDFGLTTVRSDLDDSGKVNLLDIAILLANFGKTNDNPLGPTSTPTQSGPTPTSSPTSNEWTQFGHDAQRTNFTSQAVATPWKFLWQWNGTGSDGRTQSGHLSVPHLVQPVTGGGRIYMVATNGVYALNKTNGSVVWANTSLGTLNSSPAYANELLYVASTNGNLYKLNAATGSILQTYSAGSALNHAPLLIGNRIYVPSGTNLLAVNIDNMSRAWSYSAGSTLVTTPAFSAIKNLLIVNSQDLYVHAVNVSTGTQKWKVKPTVNSYSSGLIEFENSWPVIAENHGLVFVRYRLPWQTWTDKTFPTTNSEIRAFLVSKPGDQPLFALRLDDGSSAFIPAVGNGGAGDGGSLSMGPKPVVAMARDPNNGNYEEVVYTTYRNSLTCGSGYCDGREDGTMGEMVLDNTAVPSYAPGDVRFVKYLDIQTDEMMNLTMSGTILFHGHWLINAAAIITNRSDNLGATFASPIATTNAPFVIWRQCSCVGKQIECDPKYPSMCWCSSPCDYPGCTSPPKCTSFCEFNNQSHYCSDKLCAFGDTREYQGGGFYEYMEAKNSGSSPYAVVSANQVLIKTNDGALMVLENGTPTADSSVKSNKIAGLQSSQVLGDQIDKQECNTREKIYYPGAKNCINEYITSYGVIKSAVNHLPKAIYLGFKDPHDGELLVRIFNKDLNKFSYDPMTLLGKNVEVTGKVTLYWPDNIDPEIVVTDPNQIKIIE